MKTLSLAKNKVWIRIVTIIVTTAFLCQNVVLANEGIKGKCLAAKSRLQLFFSKNDVKLSIPQEMVLFMAVGQLQKSILEEGKLDISKEIRELNANLATVDLEIITKSFEIDPESEIKYVTFNFKKEKRSFTAYFLKEDERKVNKSLMIEEKDLRHFDCPGLEGVWFVCADLAEDLLIKRKMEVFLKGRGKTFKKDFPKAVAFLQGLGVKRGTRIIDIGKEDDYYLPLAAAFLGASYVGYEIRIRQKDVEYHLDKFGIEQLEGTVQLIQGQFSTVPWSKSNDIEDNSIDVILTLSGVFSDPSKESDPEKVFDQMLRVIKPTGRIVIGSYHRMWRWGGEKEKAIQTVNELLSKPKWNGKVRLKPIREVVHTAFSTERNMGIVYDVEFIESSSARKHVGREDKEPPDGSPAKVFDIICNKTEPLKAKTIAEFLERAESTMVKDLLELRKLGLARKIGIGKEARYQVVSLINEEKRMIKKILDEEYRKVTEGYRNFNRVYARIVTVRLLFTIRAKAMRCKELNDEFVLAIDTEIGNLERYANELFEQLNKLQNALEKEGLDNVRIFVGKGAGLEDQLKRYIAEKGDNNFVINAVVKSENLKERGLYKGIKDKIQLTAVDDKNLHNADSEKVNYVPIMAILELSIKRAIGIPIEEIKRDYNELPNVKSIEEEGGILIIDFLPKPKPISVDELRKRYSYEAQVLSSA